MDLRLAIRIFDPDVHQHVSRVVRGASIRARLPVQMVPSASADVILVKRDEPGADMLLGKNAGDMPFVVLYDDENQSGHRWFLRRPAGGDDVVTLLSALQREVEATTSRGVAASTVTATVTPASATSITTHWEDASLIPVTQGKELLEHLSFREGETSLWDVQLDGGDDVLVIDSKNRHIQASGRHAENLGALVARLMTFDAQRFKAMECARFDALQAQGGLTQIPYEQFTWIACQLAEPAFPLADNIAGAPFRLKRWPSFTRIEHTMLHMRWSSRLVKSAASLNELAENEKELKEAAKFFNACAIGGLVVRGATTVSFQAQNVDTQAGVGVIATTPASPPTPEKRATTSIFQRIMLRIGAR